MARQRTFCRPKVKAFLTLGLDSEPAVQVADAVAEHIHNHQTTRIHIEEIQDIVQEELMRLGHFKVAEAYILYRAHRRHLRDLQASEPQEDERQEEGAHLQPEGLVVVALHGFR